MTDSNDYIGELELCPECGESGGHREGCPELAASQERAAWADHFKAMGWAPPEEVEELRDVAATLDEVAARYHSLSLKTEIHGNAYANGAEWHPLMAIRSRLPPRRLVVQALQRAIRDCKRASGEPND